MMRKINIETIANGALKELFERDLKLVINDIKDINTDPKAKRTIKIEIEFRPDEERGFAKIFVNCKSKLAGTKTVPSTAFIGIEGGEAVAYVNDIKQENLFDQPAANVTKLAEASGEKKTYDV